MGAGATRAGGGHERLEPDAAGAAGLTKRGGSATSVMAAGDLDGNTGADGGAGTEKGDGAEGAGAADAPPKEAGPAAAGKAATENGDAAGLGAG